MLDGAVTVAPYHGDMNVFSTSFAAKFTATPRRDETKASSKDFPPDCCFGADTVKASSGDTAPDSAPCRYICTGGDTEEPSKGFSATL